MIRIEQMKYDLHFLETRNTMKFLYYIKFLLFFIKWLFYLYLFFNFPLILNYFWCFLTFLWFGIISHVVRWEIGEKINVWIVNLLFRSSVYHTILLFLEYPPINPLWHILSFYFLNFKGKSIFSDGK